jgi:hypothetical protein
MMEPSPGTRGGTKSAPTVKVRIDRTKHPGQIWIVVDLKFVKKKKGEQSWVDPYHTDNEAVVRDDMARLVRFCEVEGGSPATFEIHNPTSLPVQVGPSLYSYWYPNL